jgi:hypothetical protein
LHVALIRIHHVNTAHHLRLLTHLHSWWESHHVHLLMLHILRSCHLLMGLLRMLLGSGLLSVLCSGIWCCRLFIFIWLFFSLGLRLIFLSWGCRCWSSRSRLRSGNCLSDWLIRLCLLLCLHALAQLTLEHLKLVGFRVGGTSNNVAILIDCLDSGNYRGSLLESLILFYLVFALDVGEHALFTLAVSLGMKLCFCHGLSSCQHIGFGEHGSFGGNFISDLDCIRTSEEQSQCKCLYFHY